MILLHQQEEGLLQTVILFARLLRPALPSREVKRSIPAPEVTLHALRTYITLPFLSQPVGFLRTLS